MSPTPPTPHDIRHKLDVFASRMGEVQSPEDKDLMGRALLEISSVVTLLVTGICVYEPAVCATPLDSLGAIVNALRHDGVKVARRDPEALAQVALCVDALFEGLDGDGPSSRVCCRLAR